MAGLVPAIHVLEARKAWMPGIKPGMTETASPHPDSFAVDPPHKAEGKKEKTEPRAMSPGFLHAEQTPEC